MSAKPDYECLNQISEALCGYRGASQDQMMARIEELKDSENASKMIRNSKSILAAASALIEALEESE